MKIDTVDVIVAAPGRNFVTLKVTTDDGLVGWGDATVNGRELAVAAYLRDHLAPILVGRDAHRIEDTWHYLYLGSYWRRGPVTMAAISAVDVALWDIKAQSADLPLYQLLGGASRERIRAYGHAFGHSLPELLDSVRENVASGMTAVRIQSGIPGLGQVYGITAAPADGDYEPAGRGGPPVEERWDTGAYLRHIPRAFAAVREEFGDSIDILHDVHHRLTPTEGAQLGRSLEEFAPFWLEDVTPLESPEALRYVREQTVVPLATGEVFNSERDYGCLLRERLVDYLRSAVSHAGGVTAVRKLADAAAPYQIKTAFHGPSDISPIGFAAALHLDFALHNFGIQEAMPRAAVTTDAFPHSYAYENGHFVPGDAPGIGARLDEAVAARFPYERAYLPVTRLRDGTMHDW